MYIVINFRVLFIYLCTSLKQTLIFVIWLMSEKKNDQRAEENPPAEIQIVTMGIKTNNLELSPSKDKEQPQANIQSLQLTPPNVHKNEGPAVEENERYDASISPGVGDHEGEEKIREHVEEILRKQLSQKQQERNESQSDEENQESNISQHSKSSKSEKKQKSPDQSNDERKEDLPTSRKCFNKLCTSKKIYKKIRSRVEQNKYRFFCKNCYENYYNNLYCEFCEQIYSNSCENQDDDKWIGCDNCERWNHIECEKRNRDKNINELKDKNLLYECLVCSQKTKINHDKNKKGEKEVMEDKIVIKQKMEINKDQRVLIFHKKNQSFPNLEYFLQNYSFRLWMNESQIREDIEYLRNVCLRVPQEENLKGKFKKVKNE